MKPVSIRFITGGQLSDSNEPTKTRFRDEFLGQDWDIENYEYWIEECLANNYNKELQDVLVSIGGKLGFDVEYGRYVGKAGEIGADGIWIRSTGDVLVIEVKAATWPGPDVSQLASYMGQLAEQRGWARQRVYGLYIVGDQNTTSLEAQIRGSYPREMRVIRYPDLLRLYQLKLDLDAVAGGTSGGPKVQQILLPMENINVGDFIALILEIAELKHASEESGVEILVEERIGETAHGWSVSELRSYLEDCTPNQRALLAILGQAPDGQWVWRTQIDAEMPSWLVELGVDTPSKANPGTVLAGTLAGLTMRRKTLKKESIIDNSEGRKLKLVEQYAGQIRAWLQVQPWFARHGASLTAPEQS